MTNTRSADLYHRILCLLVLAASCGSLLAQDFSAVLNSIDRNSTALAAARQEQEASKADASLLTALADPEVGFNYLFGNKGIGNCYDISVSQSFAFPTVIAQQKHLARELGRVAELEYLNQRQQILLQAHKLCIEVVYCNAMMDHLDLDLEETRAMAKAYRSMYERGEATIVEQNKAHQAVLFFEAEHREFNTMRNNLLLQLQAMNGGEPVVIDDTTFTHTPLPLDVESWIAQNASTHPASLLAEGQVLASQRQLSTARSEWAPSLRVGFMGEFERDSRYQGISLGFSVPVWSGKRKVKAAKAHVKAAELARQDVLNQLSNHLRTVYADALQLQQTFLDFEKHLHECDNSASLNKSLQRGEITFLVYLEERQYVHEMHEKLYATERDLELRKAELQIYQ